MLARSNFQAICIRFVSKLLSVMFFFLYSSEAEIIKYLNDLEPDTLSIILCRARLVHGPHSNEH